MPRGNGTGPTGQGPGTGQGTGRGQGAGAGQGQGTGRGQGAGAGQGRGGGRGRMGGFAGGPGGNCVCASCGEKVQHQQGVPCNQMKCPKCGAVMTRQL